MKHKNICILLLLIPFLFISCNDTEQNEQVVYEFKQYNGNVLLKNQAEVIEFGANNYTKINGFLTIGDYPNNSDINDLSPLLSINTIKGNDDDNGLYIINTDILTMYGLNNLSSLSGMIAFDNNNNLKNIDALSNLNGLIEATTEPSGLYIHNNPNLENLNGLENITGVGYMLIIRGNTKLTDLEGLNNITTDFSEVEIRNNFHLENLDALSNSTFGFGSDTFSLNITDNVHLSDFCGVYQVNTNFDFDYISCNIYGNTYNPSVDDIVNGDCSQ